MNADEQGGEAEARAAWARGVALERIAAEAAARTDDLDLGGLGLRGLPDSLFALVHLRRLNLGKDTVFAGDGFATDVTEKNQRNAVAADVRRLEGLHRLTALSVEDSDVDDLSFLTALPALGVWVCACTQVADLGPIKTLTALQSLDCSRTQVADLEPIKTLTALQSLNCSRTQVADLEPIKTLTALQSLSCFGTQVADLEPIKTLTALQSLDCSFTQVADLEPIKTLTALQSLYFWNTQVADLGPIKMLTALQSLDCSRTQVADLEPIKTLTALQSLNCARTPVADLEPIKTLTALQSLNCADTQVADLEPIKTLTALQSLNCAGTQVADLEPIKTLTALQSLDCWNTQVADLEPVKALTALQSLDCAGTPVADLEPIKTLTALQSLDCSDTQVADLEPIKTLAALQSLNCSGTQVADLEPIKTLTALQSLNCAFTQVADLEPIKTLTALQSLDCSFTQVADLEPIKTLTALQSLNCWITQVADLEPIKTLTALQSLNCSRTQVADLEPIKTLAALQSLDCSYTQVADLGPLLGLNLLRDLTLASCKIATAPLEIWWKPSLRQLYLQGASLPGVQVEQIAPDDRDCLEALRAHLRDLGPDAEEVPDVKIMVLGNGAAGKTQICNRLRGHDFVERHHSTHGIEIHSDATLPDRERDRKAVLHLWDFGGQDVYHGTHALFMRTRAVFMIVWSIGTEPDANPEYELNGIKFRNYPLQYWVDYVSHLAPPDSPVLIVQTKCDKQADERQWFPIQAAENRPGQFTKHLHYSARYPERHAASLKEGICNAIAWLREPTRQGVAQIGRGRLTVKRRLEAMRDADSERDAAARQNRLVSQAAFASMCAKAGNISSIPLFLDFLNQCGTVFYRPGLFDDQIILDQAWALDAIYDVLKREGCYQTIKAMRGRFTKEMLGGLVWQAHGDGERELLLSMMVQCDICFVHRKAEPGIPAEYIAPELLPERAVVADLLAGMFDVAQPGESIRFSYELLHPGLVRAVIARIGQQAGEAAIYWRDGVAFYEAKTRSHALIEVEQAAGAWAGALRIRTQAGDAQGLIQTLTKSVEEEEQRLGLKGSVDVDIGTGSRQRPRAPTIEAAAKRDAPKMEIVRPPVPGGAPEWFVSYAWGTRIELDLAGDPGGLMREQAVEDMCAAAAARGIRVLRDKEQVGAGESISAFMRRIGAADHVIVILSEKYLHSPFCMFELFDLWRTSRMEKERFLPRIKLYSLLERSAWKAASRVRTAGHWRRERDDLAAAINEAGVLAASEQDLRDLKLMDQFYSHVSEILALFADIVQFASIEQLAAHCFGEIKD